jgi:hypothetical protein
MIWSTVLIIPASMYEQGNIIGDHMGWGPNNFSVPLSSDGSEPATHYGLHTYSDDEFKGWIEGTIPLPEQMQDAQPIIDSMIHSFDITVTGAEHFSLVLNDNNLEYIESES